jgi:hypothetical protein
VYLRFFCILTYNRLTLVAKIIINFHVGSATVFITDTDENIVHYSVVDTSQQQEVVIPLDSFADGDYILSIEYETTILTGDFSL